MNHLGSPVLWERLHGLIGESHPYSFRGYRNPGSSTSNSKQSASENEFPQTSLGWTCRIAREPTHRYHNYQGFAYCRVSSSQWTRMFLHGSRDEYMVFLLRKESSVSIFLYRIFTGQRSRCYSRGLGYGGVMWGSRTDQQCHPCSVVISSHSISVILPNSMTCPRFVCKASMDS